MNRLEIKLKNLVLNLKNLEPGTIEYIKTEEEIEHVTKKLRDSRLGITDKPPLGLKPKSLQDLHRAQEIIEAIARFSEASKPVPEQWVTELRGLFQNLYINLNTLT